MASWGIVEPVDVLKYLSLGVSPEEIILPLPVYVSKATTSAPLIITASIPQGNISNRYFCEPIHHSTHTRDLAQIFMYDNPEHSPDFNDIGQDRNKRAIV
jgi:hypothetical protein